MNTRYIVSQLLLVTVIISGCTSLPDTKTGTSIQQKPDSSLAQAAALRKQGKWASAIETLQQALKSHPDSLTIKQTLENLQSAWQHEKQTLYQRLLISETRALIDQQKLLRSISENSPTDVKAKSGLLLKGMQLKAKLDELKHCVDYQKKHSLELARSCGELANQIEQTRDSQKRYESINLAYQQAIKQSREIRKQQSEQQLLLAAEKQIEQGHYLEANTLLKQILESSPQNKRAKKLIRELDSTLQQQAKILFSVGDQLYRDGQLKQAVVVWQSLLELTPDDAAVKSKIERAEHVLHKLESLREEQSGK